MSGGAQVQDGLVAVAHSGDRGRRCQHFNLACKSRSGWAKRTPPSETKDIKAATGQEHRLTTLRIDNNGAVGQVIQLGTPQDAIAASVESPPPLQALRRKSPVQLTCKNWGIGFRSFGDPGLI